MNAAAHLARLRSLRSRYGKDAQREQREVLAVIGALRLRTWHELEQLQQDLLFLCAFAGTAAVRRYARRLLATVGQRLRVLPRAARSRGDDSGIACSTTHHIYPFPVARWLARREEVEIDWRNVADTTLDAVVRTALTVAETEAFDSGEYGTREFVDLARPRAAKSDLQWLVSAAAAEDAWDDAGATILWQLDESPACVTHNTLRGASIARRTGLRRPPAGVLADIASPLPGVELLPARRAAEVVRCARAALAARCREVDAITYPNHNEVWWCDLGEGAALAVIGIAPEHRLTLETNTGYLLLANGVPIGYGGVTPLFRQANTGINIFDPFRGGEAAYLWTQMLRAFHTLYGSERFVINPYQFGAGNSEAIRSGAFWFYYRLGFRPVSAGVRTLAVREAKRLAGDRKYRSDARTLRALASCDLHLDLSRFDRTDSFDETLLPRAGARAARQLSAVAGSRSKAQRKLAAALAAELGIGDFSHWPRDERRGFELLAPIFADLPGMAGWAADERESLAALLRAKGLPQERTFALRSTRARRAWQSLAAALACNQYTDRGTPAV